jgi:ABC-type amino acid transport substrate-binding protein
MTQDELETRASQAVEDGTVDKVAVSSKEEVLQMVVDGKADVMSVNRVVLLGMNMLSHYAVRFHDRELGEAVRALFMKGFGLS